MNNKSFLFLLASLLSITVIAGCKVEKVSAVDKVKDSVASSSVVSDSVVVEKDVPLVVDSIPLPRQHGGAFASEPQSVAPANDLGARFKQNSDICRRKTWTICVPPLPN